MNTSFGAAVARDYTVSTPAKGLPHTIDEYKDHISANCNAVATFFGLSPEEKAKTEGKELEKKVANSEFVKVNEEGKFEVAPRYKKMSLFGSVQRGKKTVQKVSTLETEDEVIAYFKDMATRIQNGEANDTIVSLVRKAQKDASRYADNDDNETDLAKAS